MLKILRNVVGCFLVFLDWMLGPKQKKLSDDQSRLLQTRLQGLTLYQFHACPFCIKVRRYLRTQGAALPLADATQSPARDQLLQGGGKIQVPCLLIESEGKQRWLYESSDIIGFLADRLAQVGAK